MFAVSAQVHTDSLQIPQRARCQATPLRSVRERCLLLTSPFIEPARVIFWTKWRESAPRCSESTINDWIYPTVRIISRIAHWYCRTLSNLGPIGAIWCWGQILCLSLGQSSRLQSVSKHRQATELVGLAILCSICFLRWGRIRRARVSPRFADFLDREMVPIVDARA